MHQRPLNTGNISAHHAIETAIRRYAQENGVGVDKVPPYKLAMQLKSTQPELGTKGLSEQGWINMVQDVRTDMIQRAARSHEKGASFSKKTIPDTLHGGKALPSNSPLMMIGRNKSPDIRSSPVRKKPSAPPNKTKRSAKFLEALAAHESRSSGKVIDIHADTPAKLGVSRQQVLNPKTMTGGLVLTDFPNIEPVGQGRVEVHPFRWSATGVDPKGTGEDGTTLVIRTRHWADKIEGEGANFMLSLVGGNALPVKINAVKPNQHAGVVVLNISDAELEKMIGTKVGKNLNFKIDAAFTDKERPRGRHTQKCVFSIPTDQIANVSRERIGWGDHESVDINLSRTDGVVKELQSSIPELQSMTTMMETEAEFVLPPDFDMLGARKNLFAIATDPEVAASILGENWQAYPADKYIRKELGKLSQEEYDKLPMSERQTYWVHGQDGLPKTIGHTDTILDTPDRALLKKGLIMRVRANERGTVVSLKSVSQKAAGKDSRVRFCVDASLPKGTSAEDAIEIAKKLLLQRGSDELDQNPFIQGLESAGIEIGKGGLELCPTLQVESQRDRVRLVDTKDSSNIELSLDRSVLTPYSSSGQLLTDRATTSLGFEYGLEHSGVNPTDQHGSKAKAPSKKAVSGFRGFHIPSDLSHGSLHNPESTRNRALLQVVDGLTAPVFGSETPIREGGFKAVEGAEAIGLIGKGWRTTVEEREATKLDLPKPKRKLSGPEATVAEYTQEHGTLSIAQVKNLMSGNALGSLCIVAGPRERTAIAKWINANPWVRAYMSQDHLQQQLRGYGLDKL